MSDKKVDVWSEGAAVNLAHNIPPFEFDCSGWESDIPEDQWSEGDPVVLAHNIPPVELDCSGWDSEPAAWLELVVSFAADSTPASVLKRMGSLVNVATAAVPELGLTYDSDRTREEGDSVVVSLKPRNAVGAAVRLAEAADVIRTATARVAADVRVRVSTGQAA